MNILLTGRPGTGKSTALRKAIQEIGRASHVLGFVTEEVLDQNGVRTGFLQRSISDGNCATLASKHNSSLPRKVGAYYVNPSCVVDYVLPSIENAVAMSHMNGKSCTYVLDEIGIMQAETPDFLSYVMKLLTSSLAVIASITSENRDWANEIKSRDDVIILEVEESSRDTLPILLSTMTTSVYAYNALSAAQRSEVLKMTASYYAAGATIQIQKLFKSALIYVTEGRVSAVESKFGNSVFSVHGRHGRRKVTKNLDDYSCDCPLFRGIDPYDGRPGECSHIQSVRLQTI